MRIIKAHLKRQRNNGHFQFFLAFEQITTDLNPAELKIEPQFEVWQLAFRDEDRALKKVTKSPLTPEIHAADAQRDEMFRGIVDTNRASLNHYDPEKKTACRRIQIVLDAYGNVTRLPITEKTSAIFNLLEELGASHHDDVEVAGLVGWAEQLECSNKNVDRLIAERWKEISERTNISMKDVRKRVDDAYTAIVDHIHALYDVFGGEIYENFIRRLNAVIETYNAASARRR